MAYGVSRRQQRIFHVLTRRWRRRAIFLCGGVAVGLAAVVMALGADAAQALFSRFHARFAYGGLILTPLGFAAIAFLTLRFFPNASGSGIPQAIAARRLSDPAARRRLVSLRIAAGKIVLTLAGLLAGASTGREGPTVQIGAAIMFALGRLSPGRQPGLILAGAAAGVAAAFNTPLAGIVFGIEEMSRSFELRTSGLIIGAVIVAGMTSLALVGDYTYFGSTADMLTRWTDWLAIPVCGLAGGVAGGLFSRFLIFMAGGLPGRAGAWISGHRVLFAAGCGVAVALCALASDGAIDGTGYAQARAAVHGGGAALSFAPLKFAATVFSSISGIPGGIFSPSLAVGAGLGADLARLFPSSAAGAVVLLGMVSYFTGVVQAPITAFVIVNEMTGNHNMLIPLMAAALIADAASKLVCREGIYHALSRQAVPAAMPRPLPPPPLETTG